MKDNKFYDLCDKCENIDENITHGYFPSVEEIQEIVNTENLEKFVPIIAYFASDPFSRQNIAYKTLNEYKETVKYCNQLLLEINLQ